MWEGHVQEEEPWPGTSAVQEPEVRAGWRCEPSPRDWPKFRVEESDGGKGEGKRLHVLMASNLQGVRNMENRRKTEQRGRKKRRGEHLVR